METPKGSCSLQPPTHPESEGSTVRGPQVGAKQRAGGGPAQRIGASSDRNDVVGGEMVRSVAPKWPENPWVGGGGAPSRWHLCASAPVSRPSRHMAWPPEATQIRDSTVCVQPPGYQHGHGKNDCSPVSPSNALMEGALGLVDLQGMILSLNENDALSAANEVWTLGQTPLAHVLSAAGSGCWAWKKDNPIIMEVIRVCAGVDALATPEASACPHWHWRKVYFD